MLSFIHSKNRLGPIRGVKLLWIRIRAATRRRLIHRFARIDQNAKCPACGHRQGRIECSFEQRLIVHHCLVCRAFWGEAYLLAADAWLPPQGSITTHA